MGLKSSLAYGLISRRLYAAGEVQDDFFGVRVSTHDVENLGLLLRDALADIVWRVFAGVEVRNVDSEHVCNAAGQIVAAFPKLCPADAVSGASNLVGKLRLRKHGLATRTPDREAV
jgi:hypothetical protein